MLLGMAPLFGTWVVIPVYEFHRKVVAFLTASPR